MAIPYVFADGTIITGCALVDENHNRAVWGDLWSYSTVYVFNAVLENHEAAWQVGVATPSVIKQLVINKDADFFERRGVIVIPHNDARLNAAAFDYLFPKGKK